MEHGNSVASLVIVIVIAFLVPIILHRLKINFIPVVVAEILAGLIIGKSGFNIVQEDMWLETLSTLGFIFLMFLSGLEIDFSAFSSKKKKHRLENGKPEPNAFLTASIIFAGIFIVSLVLSYVFVLVGFIDNVFLMTLIISTISLGVVVPTLKEGNIMNTNIGQIILLVAVIADLATMILLAVFVSVNDGGEGNTWLLLLLFVVGVILYFVGRRYKNNNFIQSLSTGTIQIGTRAVFALIIFLVAVSESVGAENILGAFLAGVLVSLLAPNQELVHKLDSFGYGFLIPIFFVMVGVDLDIWSLFAEPMLLVFIPLLLLALLISKLIPVFYMKKWYDMKTVVASGFILTSTLSLVIAAATIGQRMGMISEEMGGMLILVAVISSIFTPIVFKKLFPKETVKEKKIKVSFIGANQITMPLSNELASDMYETSVYHTAQQKEEPFIIPAFELNELPAFSMEAIKETEILQADVVVITTGDEDINLELAEALNESGINRVICRLENPILEEKAIGAGIESFSSMLSTKTLLRALIASPSVVEIFENQETTLYDVKLRNSKFDGMTIRRFPFAGDVIFVRILRGQETIIPHGDTELLLNDRLIVTGSREYVEELKWELELH
ncbi:cation:proton antiporter [Cytobacillus sp. FSL W7-1323]|uniref:monovalent cation:proton antiporter family protein n=1 Tax=Cytobacillus sp. FSL W7-1323 TaxID=2921700 RepID=UPI003159082D